MFDIVIWHGEIINISTPINQHLRDDTFASIERSKCSISNGICDSYQDLFLLYRSFFISSFSATNTSHLFITYRTSIVDTVAIFFLLF
ncbi:MAG: hypothetical protein ACI825_001490 [Planctomycetota bacterium]|jgi:hypothetical protein